jgi:A/G-specific adenine glycosylase
MRGRVVNVLGEYDALALDDLGPRVRVDYSPDGEYGRDWLRGLVDDLANDGLVTVEKREESAVVSLQQ